MLNLPRQAHMRTLNRLIPQAHFLIIFDPPRTGTACRTPTAPPPTPNSPEGQQSDPSAKAASRLAADNSDFPTLPLNN